MEKQSTQIGHQVIHDAAAVVEKSTPTNSFRALFRLERQDSILISILCVKPQTDLALSPMSTAFSHFLLVLCLFLESTWLQSQNSLTIEKTLVVEWPVEND